MRKLNGWQRLWVALSGLSLLYALGWGLKQGSTFGGERVLPEVVQAFSDSRCKPILEMPALSKLSPEPDGDGPCWELYLYRSIYENAAVSAAGYVQDIEARRRDWMLTTISVSLLIWAVGIAAAYALGAVVAWIRRGFSNSSQRES